MGINKTIDVLRGGSHRILLSSPVKAQGSQDVITSAISQSVSQSVCYESHLEWPGQELHEHRHCWHGQSSGPSSDQW